MINEKNKFLTGSWLSGLLSAEIFISTGEQMPTLTEENRQFLRSGAQEVSLVMGKSAWFSIIGKSAYFPLTGNRFSVNGKCAHLP